jgi:hypothetical protein
VLRDVMSIYLSIRKGRNMSGIVLAHSLYLNSRRLWSWVELMEERLRTVLLWNLTLHSLYIHSTYIGQQSFTPCVAYSVHSDRRSA